VVLYRCETWSLTLREEHRLRVFENRVLSRIFEPRRDEVTENGEIFADNVLFCEERENSEYAKEHNYIHTERYSKRSVSGHNNS
jgi:hypothetical protein